MVQCGEQSTELATLLGGMPRAKLCRLVRELIQVLFPTGADFHAFLIDHGHQGLLRRFEHTDLLVLENQLIEQLGPHRLLTLFWECHRVDVEEYALTFRDKPRDRRKSQHSSILAVSLNMDATFRFASLWEAEAVIPELWHIDLREFAKDRRAEPEQLVAAQTESRRRLYQQRIAAATFPIELVCKAQLPLMTWIGWALRYVRDVTAWNDHGCTFTAFRGPQVAITPAIGHVYERLKREDSPRPPDSPDTIRSRHNEACVIIDTRSRSHRGQLDRFFRTDDGEPIICPHRYRLLRPGTEPLQPGDLVPLLSDILNFFYELRQQGIARIHLGLACPEVVAFFLGQQLNSQVISLYEYYAGTQDRYRYVFDLE